MKVKGEYSHGIDAKGRLVMPAKFREALGEEFVITKGFDGCLFVYPNAEWDAFEEKLLDLPVDVKEARQISRFFIASATDATFDKQGRVQLTPGLLKHAGITKDAAILGMGKRIEIWSQERWDANKDFDDIDDNASLLKTWGLSI